MHARPFVIAVVAAAMTWQFSDMSVASRCSYFARYPSAIGRQTFMLATATAGTVTAPLDTPHVYNPRTATAQVMAIADVAGYQSEVIRRGLRTSGRTAAFVRYQVGMSCAPFPAFDGALDSIGVNGLYVGRPRPADRWIDGRPTFDIFMAPHYPLPQRLSGPSGHVVSTRVDSTPTMTAAELFTMYRALWAESVSVGDVSVGRRIRRWLQGNSRTARKQPEDQVAMDMVAAVTDARIAANPIPFGGTFAISVVVPGVDSLVMYGQTSSRTRIWTSDIIRDSVTGVPVASVPRSFAIDVTTAASIEGFARSSIRLNPCSPIPIIVDDLPIVPDADSTWRGQVWPTAFLECAPPGSALHAVTLPGATRSFFSGPTSVTFRRHADGRVTFEALGIGGGSPGILARGERVSSVTYGSPFD